jgi:hypothetical protein
MLGFPDFFNKEKTYKSAKKFRVFLTTWSFAATAGIQHCGGGPGGSVPFFALKFMSISQGQAFSESQLAGSLTERTAFLDLRCSVPMRNQLAAVWWQPENPQPQAAFISALWMCAPADAYTQAMCRLP